MKYAAMTAFVVTLLAPLAQAQSPASAVLILEAPTVESAIGAQAAETVAELAKQYTELATMAAQLKTIVSGFNEFSALFRQTVDAVRAIARLDREFFVDAAKRGLYRAAPELAELEREVHLADKNREALEDGSFMEVRDYHDKDMAALLGAGVQAAYVSSVYPVLFPDVAKYKRKVSEAQKLVAYRYMRLGFTRDKVLNDAATRVLTEEVKQLDEEAKERQRIDLGFAGANAKAAVQTMQNTQAIRDSAEAQMSAEEAARLRRKKRSRALRRALSQGIDNIKKVGP